MICFENDKTKDFLEVFGKKYTYKKKIEKQKSLYNLTFADF
jgi:hypothetical protein